MKKNFFLTIYSLRVNSSNMESVIKKSQGIMKEISERIKQVRVDKGITLMQLSRKTGLSKSYLSQIENCEKNPPITTLAKVAFGLDYDVVSLLTGEESNKKEKKISLVKATARRKIAHPNNEFGYVYEALIQGKSDNLIEGYMVTIGSQTMEGPPSHEGQELVFVLEGRQEFFYDGKSYIIEPGDCVYFDSDRPHYARSLDGLPSKILVAFINTK